MGGPVRSLTVEYRSVIQGSAPLDLETTKDLGVAAFSVVFWMKEAGYFVLVNKKGLHQLSQ